MGEEKSITKSDFTEVLGKFTEDVLLPAIGRLIDNSADSVKEELKVEIKKSEQVNKDWTDKRVEQAEGRINLRLGGIEQKLEKADKKLDTLVDVLEDKRVIKVKDVARIKFAAEVGKT